jgi:hypothetical protein
MDLLIEKKLCAVQESSKPKNRILVRLSSLSSQDFSQRQEEYKKERMDAYFFVSVSVSVSFYFIASR